MKKLSKKLIPATLLALFFALAGLSGCEKENVKKADCEEISVDCEDTNIYIDGTDSLVNITLYDKDTVTIQKYIQGKWKVVCAKWINVTPVSVDTNAWHKFTCNKVYITGNATHCESMPYYFSKENYGTGYVLCKNTVFDIVIYGIKNDTLIYYDYGYNPIYVYSTRFK